MRLLLDSHAFIWAVDSPSRLGANALHEVGQTGNRLLLSAASIWELSIKVGIGKLSLSLPFHDWMVQAIADLNVEILPITVEYADAQTRLPNHHRDPFDRLLAAQAQVEGVALVTGDPVFERYGIARLWN